ncbi:GAF domain-containing sensor histidine kinase [Flavobacterium sp. 3HN19-14]|uniref:GAF domain-containing sensor histidine kinase n=1 Tax=Flavobacterium sp. 3HN19-14 TaxID=3448133 RepID=UPI003EE301B1
MNRTINVNEQQRLEELESYHILDTLSEKEYDDITKMASIICDTPVALITFLDSERQWFKSKIGTDITATPKEISFCMHAISSDEPFVINDTSRDERFKNNPLVTDNPNIGFYAGIPLISKNGYGLGTVCVIDTKPRTLNESQLTAMKILKDQVVNLLELHKLNYELSAHSKTLESKLDKQIADRLREVAEQNIALEKMNKELQAFAYISSHDLQEPLRKIQTFISMIEQKEYECLSDSAKEYFAKIHQSSVRMSALIKDLLAYSRASNSKKEFKKISIQSVVDSVHEDLFEEIESKQAQILLLNDMDLHVIPFQFRQLVYNLVSNSLKFSRADTIPEITINCISGNAESFALDKLEKGRIYSQITIKDNGMGFENIYNEKIFELFQRLDSNKSKFGTGIGLTIVKKIVENHSGFILASGNLDEGAVFEIYLPEMVD